MRRAPCAACAAGPGRSPGSAWMADQLGCHRDSVVSAPSIPPTSFQCPLNAVSDISARKSTALVADNVRRRAGGNWASTARLPEAGFLSYCKPRGRVAACRDAGRQHRRTDEVREPDVSGVGWDVLLVLAVICIGGFFAAAEMALVSLRGVRAAHWPGGKRGARAWRSSPRTRTDSVLSADRRHAGHAAVGRLRRGIDRLGNEFAKLMPRDVASRW